MHRPGWSEYVSELYDTSRETRKLWLDHGKPRQGPIYELHNKSRLRVKYAIRFIKRHEPNYEGSPWRRNCLIAIVMNFGRKSILSIVATCLCLLQSMV